MSDTEKWMGPDELRALADCCESLTPLWDLLTSRPTGGVTFETESLDVTAYDCDGETLGRITWGDGGAVFYPTLVNAPAEDNHPTTDTQQGERA